MIDNIWEESDHDAETGHLDPKSFPTTITGFQGMESKLQRGIIPQQR